MSRVQPLAPPWSEKDADGINSWGHPDRTYEPLLLVRCLQRHPALAGRLRKMGESLYVSALLPARTRTIAILRTCALIGCEYEWGGQAAFWGPIVGISDDECDALVTGGPDDPRWNAADRTVIDAVDELERTGFMVGRDVDRARPRPRRRATHRIAHSRRLVSHHLHAVQRARAAGGRLDACLARVSPVSGLGAGWDAGSSTAASAVVAA